MPMIRLAALSLCAAMALWTAACSRAPEPAPQAAAEDPTVPVSKAAVADLSRSVVLTAEFVPYQEVDVVAKVAGYVKEIMVDVGDHVAEGQTLAILEIPELQDELNKAKAGVEQANAEVARARDEVKRAESSHQIAHLLYGRYTDVLKERPGLLPQQEIDDAHSKDLGAEAQVASANSSLAAALQKVQVNQAEQAHARTLLDYAKVTAPFTGVVTKRFADKGSMIQAGTASQTQAMPLVRVSQNGRLRLILPVPESVVPSVHVGQQVEVHVPTLNRSFPGQVIRFADRVQSSTRTMDTEVDVLNPSLILIPGMFAEVNLTTESKSRALTVPVAAVDVNPAVGAAAQDSGTVMMVNNEGWIEVRKVALGLENSDSVEVVSGLREGDLVVTANRSSLRAGEKVKPKATTLAASAKP
jgi:RND family efflux transporter MFP subunit